MSKKKAEKARQRAHAAWINLWLEEKSVEPELMFDTFGFYTSTSCVTAWYAFLNWCAGTQDNPNADGRTCRSFHREGFDREMRKRFTIISTPDGYVYGGLTADV